MLPQGEEVGTKEEESTRKKKEVSVSKVNDFGDSLQQEKVVPPFSFRNVVDLGKRTTVL